MRRREFIAGLSLAATMQRAKAQQSARADRVAMVSPSTRVDDMTSAGHRNYRVFFEELNRLGYVEGQNLLVERFSGEGRTEHYADLARDVVSTNPDLIFSVSARLSLNFKMATATIPIVAITADPIVAGLVPSIARPGGNITGISVDAGVEIGGKRLGLLREATPKLANARFLVSQTIWERPEGAAVREAAKQAGIKMEGGLLGTVVDEAEYRRVFSLMEQDRVDGLVVSDQSEHFNYRRLLVGLAAKSRIPAIYPYFEHVEIGGLMAYSFNFEDVYRRAAGQIGEILKGTKPREIPFYQPTHFDLVINLKSARALGLEMPATLLASADKVIE
jgi:putative ABC transport system substrate-binding protein